MSKRSQMPSRRQTQLRRTRGSGVGGNLASGKKLNMAMGGNLASGKMRVGGKMLPEEPGGECGNMAGGKSGNPSGKSGKSGQSGKRRKSRKRRKRRRLGCKRQ